jgi:hypothetical protein
MMKATRLAAVSHLCVKRQAVREGFSFSLRRYPHREYVWIKSSESRPILDCPASAGPFLSTEIFHKAESALAQAIGMDLTKIVADFWQRASNQPSGRHDDSLHQTMWPGV